ncbi:carboxypeptidase regulatory-like domain-containing protein [Archangium primigenium]|uniref:carboxypeptidase regulatory-like domain-containing protein n=1 Tax=[Archangium] primigenium TaxID=2792470 RepID=UPI00195D044D|nr:carboxypeptidase regulatory-like domain-containing protein [Archangium primigenium]MBM7117025.1 carboxypeptidase regulatory-like domain-containing protein [Archangium primigenium]
MVGLAACADSSNAPWFDPQTPTEDLPGSCQVDQDCPAPNLFFCDTARARCQAACRVREDCTAARRGAYRIPACDANPLGCQCDNSQCVEAMCSADAECAASGGVCREGRCAAAPDAARARACEVTPDVLVARVGAPVRFSVRAWEASGAALGVAESAVEWTAVDPEVVRREGAGATFVGVLPTREARALVRARVGGATCTARVRVLSADVPAGRLRVVVTDALTGRPVPEATVVVADALGVIQQEDETDAEGELLLGALTGEGSVSVFHADFGYLTVAHSGLSGPTDLRLPLRRDPEALRGGAVTSFEAVVAARPELHAGLAGLSAPDAVTDLRAPPLLAPVRREVFQVDGQARLVALPEGAYAALPDSTLRQTEVRARGLAGVCAPTGPEDTESEAATRRGACGVRTAWALGGDIPSSVLPRGVGGVVDVGPLLASRVPQVRSFSSSVVRDVRFSLAAPGAEQLVPVAHDVTTDKAMPLGFAFALRVPALPRFRGVFLDSVAVLGQAEVAGRGLVPLGLGFGVNTTPVDQNTDTQPGLGAPGLVAVRMAPTHHGLEGSPYLLLLSATPAAEEEGAEASSVLLHRGLATLPFDPRGSAPVAVAGPFLGVPEGARYATEGGARRWLRFVSAPALPEGALLRGVFTDGAGRRWTVLLDAARAVEGLRLPVPPAPFEDRTYLGDHLGSRAGLSMQALDARRTGRAEGEVLRLEDLLAARSVDLAGLDAAVVGWAALNSVWPRVRWVEPAEEGQSVPRGARLRVRVTSFRVGQDALAEGTVRLTFEGGQGCAGQVVEGTSVDTQGRGEVELPLPEACSGTEVRLTASLLDREGAALSPPTTRARTVTILP